MCIRDSLNIHQPPGQRPQPFLTFCYFSIKQGILNRRGRLGGQGFGQLQMLLGKKAWFGLVQTEHADDFATAAEKAGVKLQRLNYPNEGHGFQRASNKADFWDKLDTFLAASLKR